MNYDPDDIIVLDDLIPTWLHNEVVNEIPHSMVSFGHRGLGPYQGHQFFSNQWTHQQLDNAPWQLKAVWSAFNHQKDKLGDNIGELQLNQIQINITTKNLNGGLHVDSGEDVPAYTMVYLVSGDSGMDFWSDNPDNGGKCIKEVEYKDGRCIVFPSKFIHRGLPPKEIEPRTSVGFVFSGRSTPFAQSRNIVMPIFKDQQEKIFPSHI